MKSIWRLLGDQEFMTGVAMLILSIPLTVGLVLLIWAGHTDTVAQQASYERGMSPYTSGYNIAAIFVTALDLIAAPVGFVLTITGFASWMNHGRD